MPNTWILIPARKGSKTIPKKNVRTLGKKPLIEHTLDTVCSLYDKGNIIISTDDEDVKALVSDRVLIHNRSEKNADDLATLDDVAYEVANFITEHHSATPNDIFVTVQPTSPFIKSETIEEAVRILEMDKADTVLSVADDRHLRWTIKGDAVTPLFEHRVNRQKLDPTFSETGGVIATKLDYLIKHKTRIGKEISLIEVSKKEALDIDDFTDWALAEYWHNKRKIIIRVDGARSLGFGHLYRTLAIAQNIHLHEVHFAIRSHNEFELGKNFLSNHHYPILEIDSNEDFLKQLDSIKPDIVINDILDTDYDYIKALKEAGCFVINFEDLGAGNQLADLVINDLYPDLYPQKNHWYGVEHALLNQNFENIEPKTVISEAVNHILVAYGGTDPSGLTIKALKALKEIGFSGDTTIVLGPGYPDVDEVKACASQLNGNTEVLQDIKNMPSVMIKADLALTSAGRTVTELMTLGVPTIALCQNMREMRHNHASSTYGIVNLGLGESMSAEVLSKHIHAYIEDYNLRDDMHKRMRMAIKKRSNSSIISKIFSEYNSRARK